MNERRKRGRPSGRGPQGIETKQRLYATAIQLIGDRGYSATTLRDIAAEAGVSPGLLYKYFPSKQAIVLTLYDQLSAEYAERATSLVSGSWTTRFSHALRASLDVLGPHRTALASLAGVLVADPDRSLFAEQTSFSRQRVQAAFSAAVAGASDGPAGEVGEALGRLLYLAHLLIILWWLLDKSPEQRATSALLDKVDASLPMLAMSMQLPMAAGLIASADQLVRDALIQDR